MGPITKLILTLAFIWVLIGALVYYAPFIPPAGDWALVILGIVLSAVLIMRATGGTLP